LNPKGPFYPALKAQQEASYEDCYFDEDVIYMERNSRDFQLRVTTENTNAEMMCDYFRSRRSPGPSPNGVVSPPEPSELASSPESFVLKEVYYPKFMTPENYRASLRPPNPATNFAGGGYGALFSLTFTSVLASRTFFDALPCYKGPSLGTNFTLSCPYTILAHYGELDWAKGWGVEKGLIRISVGLEDPELLLEWAKSALGAAEEAVRLAKEKGERYE
jgi:cystathionine gamma-synthase